MASVDNPAWNYEQYQVPAIFEAWARILIDFARPQSGERVLDAACGTGIVARLVAPMVAPNGEVIGLDFDPQMLAVARARAPAMEWQQGDLQQLPFADGLFDLVICQQGLQFLPDRAAGLRQIRRVLRPGGRMVLGVWTALAKSPGQAAVFGALGTMLGKDLSKPLAWSLTDEREILALLSAAGFADIETTVTSRPVSYPSARRFVEMFVSGTSKLTQEILEQIPTERKTAFFDEVAERLGHYETAAGFAAPMESRILVTRKPRA